MERKDDDLPNAEQAGADRERVAREALEALAGDALTEPPWRPAPAPPSAVDLVNVALWRAGDLSADDVERALSLLPAARAEVDGLEAGLLFVARSAGLTWARIADAMGFRSPQACQQHFTRLAARQEEVS